MKSTNQGENKIFSKSMYIGIYKKSINASKFANIINVRNKFLALTTFGK